MKIKKDLPTILKLQRENNLDQEWLIDRIEEYMLGIIAENKPEWSSHTLYEKSRYKRLMKFLGREKK